MGTWVSVQALFFSTTLAFDVQSPKQSLVQVVSLCTQRKSRSCKPAERTNVKRMIGNGGAASQSETPTEPIPRLIPYSVPLWHPSRRDAQQAQRSTSWPCRPTLRPCSRRNPCVLVPIVVGGWRAELRVPQSAGEGWVPCQSHTPPLQGQSRHGAWTRRALLTHPSLARRTRVRRLWLSRARDLASTGPALARTDQQIRSVV